MVTLPTSLLEETWLLSPQVYQGRWTLTGDKQTGASCPEARPQAEADVYVGGDRFHSSWGLATSASIILFDTPRRN